MTGSATPLDGAPGSPSSSRESPGPKFTSAARLPSRRRDGRIQRPWPGVAMDALQPVCEAAETPLPDSLAARLDVLAPTEDALTTFLNHLATSVGGENAAGRPISDCEAFAAGLPLETPVVFAGPEAQILALVQDFHRRQRRATFLVAGCVAISCVLTIVTIAAMASFAGRASADNGDPA